MSTGPLTLQSDDRVYLDYNATTPLAAFLRPKIQAWIEHWGNPSSIHWSGREPKALLRDACRSLARFIKADPLELIFTSGGSEANNLAIKGVFDAIQFGRMQALAGRNQYLVSAVEHPSVMKAMNYLSDRGADVRVIPVNRRGEINLEAYKQLLSEKTALVSVMYANNETGNIFPIDKISKLAHASGALFHCDGVQAVGKAAVDVKSWGVDLASFAGHKFYSLKGCGLLYARKGLNIESLIHGGGQERGRRAGTENLLGIAAFGAVVDQLTDVQVHIETMASLRNHLQTQLLKRVPGVHVTGAESPRLCNTMSVVIDGIDGETLLMNLDMRGYSVSTGAACSSGNPEPSPVLLTMGLSRAEAQSSLRVSLGWDTTMAQIESFLTTLEQVIVRLRGFQHGEKAIYGL